MEQSPSGEAKISSASEKFPRILWIPEVFLSYLKEPSHFSYAEPGISNPRLTIRFLEHPFKHYIPTAKKKNGFSELRFFGCNIL
jgi:hypothetical protein